MLSFDFKSIPARADEFLTKMGVLAKRDDVRRAGNDVFLSAAPQAFGLVSGVLTSVLVARGLGPKGLGQYALATSLGAIIGMLSDLGINQTAIRFASNAVSSGDSERQFSVLRWAFYLRLGLLLTFGALGWIAAPVLANRVWGEPDLSSLLRLGILCSGVSALSGIPGVYFQSMRRFSKNAYISIVQKLITLAGIIIIWITQAWRVNTVLWVSLASGFVGSAVFLSLLPKAAMLAGRRTVSRPLEQPIGDPWHFLKFNVLSTLVVGATSQIDSWALARMLGTSDLGLYAAAQRTTLPLTVILAGINTALWPRASALTDVHSIAKLLNRSLLLCGALAVGVLIYAATVPLLLPTLFGQAYAKGTQTGRLLCLSYSLLVLACPAGLIAYSVGYVRVAWIINLLQLGVESVSLYLFLPRLGITGAALAFFLNSATAAILAWMYIARRIRHLKAAEPTDQPQLLATGLHT